MDQLRVGFALCGSFCTLSKALIQMRELKALGADIFPIMSENAYSTDTRFGKAADIVAEIEDICGRPVIHTIRDAEPIGPKRMIDILIIEPCTGNTLAKLANGITDTPVTLAAKAHIRNGGAVLIAVSTNDALGARRSMYWAGWQRKTRPRRKNEGRSAFFRRKRPAGKRRFGFCGVFRFFSLFHFFPAELHIRPFRFPWKNSEIMTRPKLLYRFLPFRVSVRHW